MAIEDRRTREKHKMKDLILQAAEQIIITEGYDKLSIRKIADRIEYSPAIIYHYFRNKSDILSQVLRQGHESLISALSDRLTAYDTPESRLRGLTQKYIEAALENPAGYLAVQLNDSPEVLEFTAYLFKGAAKEKPALKLLSQAVKEILSDRDRTEREIEMTAQIIAVSTFGFITKLILEKDIGDTQKKLLIERFLETVVCMTCLSRN